MASRGPKARFKPLLGAYYRLAYNAFAALHLALIIACGYWLFADPAPIPNPFWPVAVLGILVLIVALRDYDLSRLMGTFQIRHPEAPEDEPLHIRGLHRFVRHPLYAGTMLVLWGKVSDEFEMATAVWASFYILAGAAFEERRLLGLYGEGYAEYRRRVPAFIPWIRP